MNGESDREPPPEFMIWLSEVDRIMKQDWYIDTHDAGTETARLIAHWEDGDTPAEYVAWFADKYDLIDFRY